MALSVGTKAPDFNLKSKQASGLVDVKLSGNFGQKHTVLLFFPLAFTSVCTKEMCDMTAGLGSYSGLNAEVIGISVDSPFLAIYLKRYSRHESLLWLAVGEVHPKNTRNIVLSEKFCQADVSNHLKCNLRRPWLTRLESSH